MSHHDVIIVTATKPNRCELCSGEICPGDRIEYYAGPPRGVRHIECGLRARRDRS